MLWRQLVLVFLHNTISYSIDGYEVKLLLLMNLITAVANQVQDKEILDISIVKKVEYDEETNTYKLEEEEMDEEERTRLLEEKKCQRNEFLHLHNQLSELISVLSTANLFKRCLLHCIQAISSKSQLIKTMVFLEFPFYV